MPGRAVGGKENPRPIMLIGFLPNDAMEKTSLKLSKGQK